MPNYLVSRLSVNGSLIFWVVSLCKSHIKVRKGQNIFECSVCFDATWLAESFLMCCCSRWCLWLLLLQWTVMNSLPIFSACRGWSVRDVDAAAAGGVVRCSALCCCCSELSWTVCTYFLVSGIPKLFHFPLGGQSVLYFLSLLDLCLFVLHLLDVICHQELGFVYLPPHNWKESKIGFFL